MTQDALPIWTIYDRPSDFPDSVILRESWSWVFCWPGRTTGVANLTPAPHCRQFQTITQARTLCRHWGLYCLARQPGDDPVIVETWI